MAHHKHFDRQKAAHRGWIYKYNNAQGEDTGRLALVVSAEDRCSDKIVSVIILSEKRCFQDDEVKLRVDGSTCYAHCGNVTYCRRYQLRAKAGECEPLIMQRIEAKLSEQLGLSQPQRQDFERLYYDLLKTLDIKPEQEDGKEEEDNGENINWFTRMRQRLLRI